MLGVSWSKITDARYSARLTSLDTNILRSRMTAFFDDKYAIGDGYDAFVMDKLTSLRGLPPSVKLCLLELEGLT